MKLSLPPKLVEKLVCVPVISFCKIFIPSSAIDAILCRNWVFPPPNQPCTCFMSVSISGIHQCWVGTWFDGLEPAVPVSKKPNWNWVSDFWNQFQNWKLLGIIGHGTRFPDLFLCRIWTGIFEKKRQEPGGYPEETARVSTYPSIFEPKTIHQQDPIGTGFPTHPGVVLLQPHPSK